MIVRPVLIVGAPRSGTSLLQKILRDYPGFWSMPSESDIVWDRFCHPSLHGWHSESLGADDLRLADKDRILQLFEAYARPAGYWAPFEQKDLIWGFSRAPVLRRVLRSAYSHALPVLARFRRNDRPKRLLEKTASNCFRLGYVNEVFPDAKIIYPCRDGRNNVNSLINAWRHPRRFFTYDVPAPLAMAGCPHARWKFVLPPGWRDYAQRPLEEVCAFQWRSCHEAMLDECAKEKYRGRVLRVRLEDLAADPAAELGKLAEFLELPFDDYFRGVAAELPVVNSADNDTSPDKWRSENRDKIERIMPDIEPVMRRLGYVP